MGQVKSQTILVIGLSGVGKTHFLDLFHYGPDSYKTPTNGFYEVKFNNCIFIEYGSNTSWSKLLHQFDRIILIVDGNFSDMEMILSKTLLLSFLTKMDQKIPICILWKNKPSKKIALLQLEALKANYPVFVLSVEDLSDTKGLWSWIENAAGRPANPKE